ncbi:MAG: hypothetical protein ACI8SE_001527 [Bacteroidia bacterium]|jgi:hypothetical protein
MMEDSIAVLPTKESIANGLKKLRDYMDNNHIQEIINDYKNDLGDYLFIIGEK